MLNRQRMILALLDHAGAPVENTMLVKLAFLLREETAVGQDKVLTVTKTFSRSTGVSPYRCSTAR